MEIADESLKKFLNTWDGSGDVIDEYNKYIKNANSATSAFSATLKSVVANMAIMLAINAVIKAVAWAWDELNVTVDEQQAKVDELTSSYEGLKSEYDALRTKDNLTQAEQDRLNYLERQLELQNKLLEIETKRLYQNKVGTSWTDIFDGESLANKQYTEENAFSNDSFKNQKLKYETTMESYHQNHASGTTHLEAQNIATLEDMYDDLVIKQSDFLANMQEAQEATKYLTGEDQKVAQDQADYWENAYNDVCLMVDEIDKIQGRYDFDPTRLSGRLGGSISADELKNEFSSEEIDLLLEAKFDENATIEDLKEVLKKAQNEADENEVDLNLSISDQLAKVESLSEGLDQLDEIYSDILDKEDFDFSSILNNDDFANAFSQYTNEYENFIDTITKSPDDINACQQAFNELATAYINGSDALNTLTEATRDSAINELQQMGVVNSEEVVDAYLRIANAKRDALAAGVDMENITLAEINSLYNEGIIALTTAQYLAYYQFQKALSNENGINTQADCENLIALATNAGITGDVINSLNELMALHQEISLAAQYQDKDTVAVLTARADELLASIKSQASTMESAYNPVVKYTGGTNSLAAANKNLKNATDASNDALKSQKEQLEKNKEALEETKSEYETLFEAVDYFYQKQEDKISDQIEGLQDVNEQLEKQLDNLDGIMSAMDLVYESEIKNLKAQQDAIDDAVDGKEKELAVENALKKVREANSRKVLGVYEKGKGVVYKQDEKAISEAMDEYEQANAEKAKADIQDKIDLIESYRDRLNEIPKAWENAYNAQLAYERLGTDWQSAILNPSDDLFDNLESDYIGIQSNIASNDSKIDSLEAEKERISELRDLWNDAKNEYKYSQYEMLLSSFIGSDYEYQLLNNSATWRRKFADEYSSICAEIEALEEQIKSLNEETASSVESGANRISNAANGVKSALENTGNLSKYIWDDATDGETLRAAQKEFDQLTYWIEQGKTGFIGARDALAIFLQEYPKLNGATEASEELKNSVSTLQGIYENTGRSFGTMIDNADGRITDFEVKSRTLSENLTEVDTQMQSIGNSEEQVEETVNTELSNVETTISNLLTKLGELQTKLGEISSSRTEIETIADEELLDTSAVVDGVHTKVGEIQNAITTLMESITPLHGALDTLMEKMTTLDEVTLSNVISAFGGASGGEGGESKESGSNKQSKGKKGSEGESSGGGSGLLGAVKAVDEAIGSVDNEESLLGKLAQVDASTLENIIAQFGLSGENGDSEGANLLNAVNAVSQAIVGGGKDDENSLIASIEQLGSDPTIEHVTTVSDSFQTLHDTINECVKKVEELSKAIESIPSSTATVGVNGGKSSGRAKGGIITKKDAGDLDFVAKSLGEDHMVALTEGEAVIPKETVAKNSEAIDSLLSGQKLDLKALVNRDIVLQRATPLDTYKMLEKYQDWIIPDSVIMSRLNLPSQDFSKFGVVNNNQKETVVQFNGDIHVHEVQNVDTLSKAIVQQLPRKMTQALSRRDL